MTADQAIDIALQRLLRIMWQFDDTRLHSHAQLVKEYLRRAALWTQVIQVTISWPLYDVAAHIVPTIRAPQPALDRLSTHLESIDLFTVVKQTCIWYLHWSSVKGHPEVTALTLPDPYEPLIRLYERGGYFRIEHNFICLEPILIPIVDWHKHLSPSPVTPLDDASLDIIDLEAIKK